jgi:CDP-glycerol glycerophosphotransferase (TagB/SpsB family)
MFLERIFKNRRRKVKLISFLDCFFPKSKNKIIFVAKHLVCYSGNIRVALEAQIENNNKKIFLYKDGFIKNEIKKELSDLGVVVLEGFSLKAIYHILTTKYIVLGHNPRDANLTKKCNRKIINLWHGVAIKKIELLMKNVDSERKKLMEKNSKLYDIVIASSDEDAKTNSKAFGVPLSRIKVIGLPRYEILKNEYSLSKYLQQENQYILDIKKNKKLILYAPTFRENSVLPLEEITKDEWIKIKKFMEKQNYIFVIRPHPYDKFTIPDYIKSDCIIILDTYKITETNLLLRYTDLLIVDFSSIWIDFLLTQKPILGFSKSFYTYTSFERGFIYDFRKIFPSIFTNNIDEMLFHIEKNMKNFKFNENYLSTKNKFHKYDITHNFKKEIQYLLKEL